MQSIEIVDSGATRPISVSWYRRISYLVLILTILPYVVYFISEAISIVGSCYGNFFTGIHCSGSMYQGLMSFIQGIVVLYGMTFFFVGLPSIVASILLGVNGILKRKRDIEQNKALSVWKEPYLYNILLPIIVVVAVFFRLT